MERDEAEELSSLCWDAHNLLTIDKKALSYEDAIHAAEVWERIELYSAKLKPASTTLIRFQCHIRDHYKSPLFEAYIKQQEEVQSEPTKSQE